MGANRFAWAGATRRAAPLRRSRPLRRSPCARRDSSPGRSVPRRSLPRSGLAPRYTRRSSPPRRWTPPRRSRPPRCSSASRWPISRHNKISAIRKWLHDKHLCMYRRAIPLTPRSEYPVRCFEISRHGPAPASRGRPRPCAIPGFVSARSGRRSGICRGCVGPHLRNDVHSARASRVPPHGPLPPRIANIHLSMPCQSDPVITKSGAISTPRAGANKRMSAASPHE